MFHLEQGSFPFLISHKSILSPTIFQAGSQSNRPAVTSQRTLVPVPRAPQPCLLGRLRPQTLADLAWLLMLSYTHAHRLFRPCSFY